jgi:hypothetical protein
VVTRGRSRQGKESIIALRSSKGRPKNLVSKEVRSRQRTGFRLRSSEFVRFLIWSGLVPKS